ncbi:MFS transporter [Mobiluncus mulieris]|uniref:MFS transporter n=1 Tax=Mobiluncus mulieris TaxID=2052 RepID=A0A7Y0U157_9ACTO|nr:MFS transporter [Mobiluncus mulieris]NMW65033.1 MFS transporter [Mobiluncus mulieris]
MTAESIQSIDDMGMSPFLKRVTIFSSGGPFLEGYVLAIVGVALVPIAEELKIDSWWSGMIGVASLIGLMFGATLGGWLTDLVGRKKMFVLDVLIIILLSVLCMFITSPHQLFVLRLLLGVAVGADYPIATSMIIEFTPLRYRAISMGFIAAVWYLGANVAYLAGYFFVETPNGWRWMLGSSVIPCVIILFGRWFIPESPRWLMSKGRVEESEAIVHQFYGQNIVLGDEPIEKTKVSKIFQGTYVKRILFVGVIWLCQAIPMYAIYTYGPVILTKLGLGEGRPSLIGEMIIGTFFLIGTIPAMFLAEWWGRRPLIIYTFLGMTIAMAALSMLPSPSFVTIFICFGLYALLAGGPGNLQWLYPNELFPTDVRGTAMGFAMAFSRIGTVVSIYVLPSFLEMYGSQAMMMAAAIISAVGLAVSIVWAPETKGLTLAQTSAKEFRG